MVKIQWILIKKYIPKKVNNNKFELVNSYLINIFLVYYVKSSDKFVRNCRLERLSAKFWTPCTPKLLYLFFFTKKNDLCE